MREINDRRRDELSEKPVASLLQGPVQRAGNDWRQSNEGALAMTRQADNKNSPALHRQGGCEKS